MNIATQARAVFLFLSSIVLIACGGGGDGDSEPDVVQGQFIDSIVIGLRYSTPTTSGLTNDQGRFNYRAGETVRFYVGDVFIGEAKGQAVITPVELVSGAVDENNDQVINIAIFLQSIDDDGNEANGIRITAAANDEAAGRMVDFMQTASAFDADGSIQTLIGSMIASNGAAHALVSRDQARSALRGNLLGLLVGEYRGTFAGNDTGNWVAMVDASGDITGTSTSNEYGSDAISGTLSSSGEASISGTVGTSVFSGNFSRNGRASGTWTDTSSVSSGTFTGSRVSLMVGSEEARLPGCWNWSNDAYVVIERGGRAWNGLLPATWTADNIASGRYTLTWPPFVDTVSLSADGSRMSGSNNYGWPVTATRVSGEPSSILGEWLWNGVAPVTARADSTISGGGYSGTWSQSGENWLVVWPLVDSIRLSNDGNSLSLTNQFGAATATRDVNCTGG